MKEERTIAVAERTLILQAENLLNTGEMRMERTNPPFYVSSLLLIMEFVRTL